MGTGKPSFSFCAQSFGMARSAASRRAIFVCSPFALNGVGMVRETLNTSLSRNGTRLSSEGAIDILSVFSRMSPTSQKKRSTYCMRVVSSRSDTSAYAGAISSCGEHACTGRFSRRARSSGLNATPLALV